MKKSTYKNAQNHEEVKALAEMEAGETTKKGNVAPVTRASVITEAASKAKGKGKAPKAPKAKKEKAPRKPSAGVNNYGVRIGSDAETITKMAEAGKYTMSQIIEKTGGKTRYNLLRDLQARGHKVEIAPDTHIITLKAGKAPKAAQKAEGSKAA